MEATGTAPATMSEAQAEALVMERKREAAKQATTVSDMGSRFNSEMDDLMKNPQPQDQQHLAEGYGDGASADEGVAPEVLQRVKEKHVAEMDEATNGKGGINLMQTEPGHLGQNQVGNGDAPMKLSSDLYADLDGTGENIEEIDVVKAHESAHGRQVDAPIEWLEGHAEISANEETGKGASFRRPGQPQELYAEGQTTVEDAVAVLGRSRVEKGMTEDFDEIIIGLMESESARAKELLNEIAESN